MFGEDLAALSADHVSPAVVALASTAAPNKLVLARAGGFEQAHITMTRDVYLGAGENPVEAILANWERIADRTSEFVPSTGFEQYRFEGARAREHSPVRE